jgi:3-oxoacyl-[acyl-carrier-protein] synthase-3
MIGVRDIGSYIPANVEFNLAKLDMFHTDEAFVREKVGVLQVSRMDAGDETSDLCVKAWKDLQDRCGLLPEDLEAIVLCTQNPDGRGIPHTSAIVQAKIGAAESTACFDISLACSGYVYGLEILSSFMQAHRLRRGVFLTADPYSKILDPSDKNTALLFGDASTATLLEQGAPWVTRASCFATNGKSWNALHNSGGSLRMDGRAIFNFSMLEVPKQVERLLDQAGLSADEVDRFYFHQGSRYLVDNLRKRMGLASKKVPLRLESHGNTVSSSLPLLWQSEMNDASVRRVVLAGFGGGLSWACSLLERSE